MKYGRLDSDPNRVTLPFKNYVRGITVPDNFGHYTAVKDWGMLANDRYGCCAWASAAHESMEQNAANGRLVTFSDANVLSDYATATGFDPSVTPDPETGQNPTDKGSDMHTVYQYRHQVGILDAYGNRHKIGAYLELEPGNPDELAAAAYLFGAVGLGIIVHDWTERQFAQDVPWHYVPGGEAKGGHAIPIVGRHSGFWEFVSWGQCRPMTNKFFEKETTEVFVAITDDYLTGDKSPEGLDSEALLNDMQELAKDQS
jgi:hypothetical protein